MRIKHNLTIRFIPVLSVCFLSLMLPPVYAEEIKADITATAENQALEMAKEKKDLRKKLNNNNANARKVNRQKNRPK